MKNTGEPLNTQYDAFSGMFIFQTTCELAILLNLWGWQINWESKTETSNCGNSKLQICDQKSWESGICEVIAQHFVRKSSPCEKVRFTEQASRGMPFHSLRSDPLIQSCGLSRHPECISWAIRRLAGCPTGWATLGEEKVTISSRPKRGWSGLFNLFLKNMGMIGSAIGFEAQVMILQAVLCQIRIKGAANLHLGVVLLLHVFPQIGFVTAVSAEQCTQDQMISILGR